MEKYTHLVIFIEVIEVNHEKTVRMNLIPLYQREHVISKRIDNSTITEEDVLYSLHIEELSEIQGKIKLLENSIKDVVDIVKFKREVIKEYTK